MNKKDWHLLLFLLLSHNSPENLDRTIHVKLWGRNVYLCARCTGIYSSISIVFIAWFLGFGFPTWLYLPLFSILPIPSAVDWITQSCGLRESRNWIRICTGSLFGVSQGLFLLMLIESRFFLFLQALAVVGVYLFSVYIIAWKTKLFGSRKVKMLGNKKS
jgi:uncharacterized membrane protein